MSKKKAGKSNTINELIDFLFVVDIFISAIIFSKTKNIKFVGVFFFLFLVSIIVIFYFLKERKRKTYLDSGINMVDKMSGEEFETFLSVHFKELGYRVELTPITNDYGADLILKKDNRKFVLQAKRWATKVGIGAVQEIVASINYYNADKGIVISNNFFTKNAYELALKNNIELWNRNKLIEIMSKSNGKIIANNIVMDEVFESNIKQEREIIEEICPRCGGKLIVRLGKRGKFFGCTNFPNCKFTKNIVL